MMESRAKEVSETDVIEAGRAKRAAKRGDDALLPGALCVLPKRVRIDVPNAVVADLAIVEHIVPDAATSCVEPQPKRQHI